MLVFKENVKAFVYDSSNDEVTKVFDRQLSAQESILIMEVIEGCGYEVDEITFEELCEQISGIYDIVEVTGDFQLNWLIKE